MDTSFLTCPQCHTQIPAAYYFCYNCGKNLRPVPLSVTPLTQLGLYIGSIALSPLGLIWGMRYLRQSSPKAKLVGVVCIVLTVLTLLIVSKLLTNYIAQVNEQVTQQLNGMQGF